MSLSANNSTNSIDTPFLSQWKLLDDPFLPVQSGLLPFNRTRQKKAMRARRFKGFASWDRMLEDWKEDIQEYMEKSGMDGSISSAFDIDLASGSKDNATSLLDRISGETFRLPIPASAQPGEAVVPETDLSDKSKKICIVTTASLPWMTGTAVNPLLRAAYMTKGRKEAGGRVTLMLPWLERRLDQEQVYGKDRVFADQDEQEQYIRTWLKDTAKMDDASRELGIQWYTAWQNKAENSVYSMGDITALISADDVDICILEEPEHLNWYRAPGQPWTDKFKHVVGIIHTNYFVYAQDQPAALIRAPAMRLLCSWMCRAHCHRMIKLSGTLGQFAPEKELIENVHGVRGKFLETGDALRSILQSPEKETHPVFSPTAEPSVYFIGKMLWSKGLGSLMELLKYAEESAGIKLTVDMYGGGPDKDAASQRSESLGLDMTFHGPVDHSELAFTHKVFINPSTSEVLCTTVAEALAMGKFVVVPSHPSNDFFAQFPNCLTYTTKEEFVGDLYYALTHSPEPLSEDYSHALSWQAAIERLEAAGSIPVREKEAMAEAVLANEAGIEILLPSLIDDEKGRNRLAETLRQSRSRYRLFRDRLSTELRQNNVLPNPIKQRLVSELNKRLELDIDEILESPKLRLKLSPAELDKQLLDLYIKVTDGPSGDILRIIGGGQDVAMQNLYIKRRARKERMSQQGNSTSSLLSFGKLDPLGDDTETSRRTASQWVNWALRRNLPKPGSSFTADPQELHTSTSDHDSLKMRMGMNHRRKSFGSPPLFVSPQRRTPIPVRRSMASTLLI